MRIMEWKIRLQEGSQNTTTVTAGNEANPNVPVVNPQTLLPRFDERRDDQHTYSAHGLKRDTASAWPALHAAPPVDARGS